MTNETLEVTIVNESGLERILQESHLEKADAEQIRISYLPFLEEMALIEEEAKKINFENPTLLDEQISRSLRLRMVKVRTGSEGVKDERKKIHLLRSNVEQSAFNLIKSKAQLKEEEFLQVEKKREIAEAKLKAEHKAAREAEINELGLAEFIPSVIDLGTLSNDDYVKLRYGAEMQLQHRQEAAAKAELERIEREKAEAAERERIRVENEKLKAEAAEKEKALAKERAKVEKERLAAEAIRKAEQEKADALLESQRKAAAKAKAEADKKLAAAEAEKKRIAGELKARQDAEAAEEKARVLAAKKAQAAPDKEKLRQLSIAINSIAFPELQSEDAQQILSDVQTMLEKVRLFIGQKCATL